MKIARLLEQDRKLLTPGSSETDDHLSFTSLSRGTLLLSLGDSYLFHHNTIFRNIRNQVLAANVKFVLDSTPEISRFFSVLPLSLLDELIAQKTIPYTDNVSVLLELERKIPETVVLDDLIDNLKKNHVFHESCHLVARSLLIPGLLSEPKGQEFRQRVFLSLFEESFANSCELMGIVDVHDNYHRSFYELQSYIFMMQDRARFLDVLKTTDAIAVFKFVHLCYLHANFLIEEISDVDMSRFLQLAFEGVASQVPTGNRLKLWRGFFRSACDLNPRFREVTTRFYFKLQGFKQEFHTLLDFDFLNHLESDVALRRSLHALAKTAVNGLVKKEGATQ